MTIPRAKQFDASSPPWLHCISRCVRRAYLCGTDPAGRDVEHRKGWVEARLRLIARSAACEVAGYAVMSNHLHVVLRMRPDLAAGWSAMEVVRRWLAIWPRERLSDGTPVEPSCQELEQLAKNTAQVAIWRQRLGDLGWTMKALKEDLSRRANKEDECSGAFWEGRFKSVPLLDQAALVSCMAYVDLNPIRAKVAKTPETSQFTGAYERIRVRQAVRKAAGLRRAGDADGAAKVLAKAGIVSGNHPGGPGSPRFEWGGLADGRRLADSPDDEADRASWLTPIACCVADGDPLTLDEYLTLVDGTGRIIRNGKRGAIPAELAPILARLDLDIERWLDCMLGWRQFLGAAVGRLASRAVEATRRGLQWVQNRCALFAPAPA